MHNDTLTSTNCYIDNAEGPVIEHSSENVPGIVDDSGVHKVEDAHDDEHIEHIGEVARCSVQFVGIVVEIRVYGILFVISISNSS